MEWLIMAVLAIETDSKVGTIISTLAFIWFLIFTRNAFFFVVLKELVEMGLDLDHI